jgi:hypothetical protein
MNKTERVKEYREKLEYLSDYLLKCGARNRAFISYEGEVYIVKDFRVVGNYPTRISVLDVDMITKEINGITPHRQRMGLPLSGKDSHLRDRKATLSDIQKARFG